MNDPRQHKHPRDFWGAAYRGGDGVPGGVCTWPAPHLCGLCTWLSAESPSQVLPGHTFLQAWTGFLYVVERRKNRRPVELGGSKHKNSTRFVFLILLRSHLAYVCDENQKNPPPFSIKKFHLGNVAGSSSIHVMEQYHYCTSP